MEQQLFPTVRNSNVTLQLKRYHIPTSVARMCNKDFFGTLAILEPHLVTSFIDVSKPICLHEFSPSGLLKCFPQFWTYRIPMNSAVRFSF